MLSDNAALPRPKWVMKLLVVPPGHAATSNMATSIGGGRSSASVASQVTAGSSRNWGMSPATTARGACATRRKSRSLISSEIEKTSSAMTALKAIC